MPLIRFRTGDIAAIEKPECGYKLETMKHIVSRLEGSYSLTSGEIINPPILEEAILKVEEVSDYQVYIKENNQLYIKAENSRFRRASKFILSKGFIFTRNENLFYIHFTPDCLYL